MTRAIGVTARMAYHKNHPHVATVMQNAMSEHGFTVTSLSHASGVSEEEINAILEKKRVITPKLSLTIGKAFGFGKERLYRIHSSWMEAGGSAQ